MGTLRSCSAFPGCLLFHFLGVFFFFVFFLLSFFSSGSFRRGEGLGQGAHGQYRPPPAALTSLLPAL